MCSKHISKIQSCYLTGKYQTNLHLSILKCSLHRIIVYQWRACEQLGCRRNLTLFRISTFISYFSFSLLLYFFRFTLFISKYLAIGYRRFSSVLYINLQLLVNVKFPNGLYARRNIIIEFNFQPLIGHQSQFFIVGYIITC